MKTLLLTIILLINFIFFTLQILLTHSFLNYEYSKPNFPPDSYDYTQEQRLELAIPSIDFLNYNGSAEDAKFILENQGIYTESEVEHLLDVKNIINWIDILGTLSFLGLLGYAIYLLKKNRGGEYLKLLRNSEIAILAVIIIAGLLVLFSWETLFIKFHEILFPQGNWSFAADSSLIRLFPEQFWVDSAVTFIGLLVILNFIIILGSEYFLRLDSNSHPQSDST